MDFRQKFKGKLRNWLLKPTDRKKKFLAWLVADVFFAFFAILAASLFFLFTGNGQLATRFVVHGEPALISIAITMHTIGECWLWRGKQENNKLTESDGGCLIDIGFWSGLVVVSCTIVIYMAVANESTNLPPFATIGSLIFSLVAVVLSGCIIWTLAKKA